MNAFVSGVLGFTAILAAGCGVTVIVPDEPGTGGDGASSSSSSSSSGASSSSSSSTSTGSGSPLPGCTPGCSQPSNGVDTCSCNLDCNGVFAATATCFPIVDLQGNHKIECSCHVAEEFTGVCYETNPEYLCTFDHGCCGKYLGK